MSGVLLYWHIFNHISRKHQNRRYNFKTFRLLRPIIKINFSLSAFKTLIKSWRQSLLTSRRIVFNTNVKVHSRSFQPDLSKTKEHFLYSINKLYICLPKYDKITVVILHYKVIFSSIKWLNQQEDTMGEKKRHCMSWVFLKKS